MKKIIITHLMLPIFAIILLIAIINLADKISPSNYCIEDGDCYEGDKIKINENVTITVNKENCLKYHWSWDEKRNMCKVDYRDIR